MQYTFIDLLILSMYLVCTYVHDKFKKKCISDYCLLLGFFSSYLVTCGFPMENRIGMDLEKREMFGKKERRENEVIIKT